MRPRMHYLLLFTRSKTTSAQYVASRFRDPSFEKLMDNYKNYNKKLHLNRGAASFLRKYPHIFHIFYDPVKSQPHCRLTEAANRISREEEEAIKASLPIVVERLVRLLAMSTPKSLPLRAVYKVWKELGLPDDFEDSVIAANSPRIFKLFAGHEPGTHVLKLVDEMPMRNFTASVDNWRVMECCKENCKIDATELKYGFKQGFPSGMRLSKDFKAKVKEWQRLPYVGPYEATMGDTKKAGYRGLEKRAVAIVHEFLSLTVEKMVEVEKISHFRKCFEIDFNIRDLFLDHPGIFYLSTKGKRHTVFLREAYERGRLIQPNPVYDIRRKLLHLVVLGRRGGDVDQREGNNC